MKPENSGKVISFAKIIALACAFAVVSREIYFNLGGHEAAAAAFILGIGFAIAIVMQVCKKSFIKAIPLILVGLCFVIEFIQQVLVIFGV